MSAPAISARIEVIIRHIEQFAIDKCNGEVIIRFRDGIPVELEPRPKIKISTN